MKKGSFLTLKTAPSLFETKRAICAGLLGLCLAFANDARSQNFTFTTSAPLDVSQTAGNELNPSVAINPLNPSNVFVVASSDLGGLVTSYSLDQGKTWTTNIIAQGTDGLIQAYQYPSAAFDSFGNLYVAYFPTTFEGVAIDLSTNGGQSFSNFTELAPNDATDTPRIAAGPATAPGAVWVVYKDYSQAGTPLIAQGLLATNLGTTNVFGSPLTIPGSASSGFPDIAVGPVGQVLVAYQNNLSVSNAAKISASVNTNGFGGGSFGQAVSVTATAAGGLTYIPAEATGIGINASVSVAWDVDTYSPYYGRAYIIYTTSGAAKIGFQYSSNNGSSWSAQETVNDDNSGNSHFMPRVAVDPVTGVVACSWYDCRNDQGSSSAAITEQENSTFNFSGLLATNITVTSNGVTDPFFSVTTNSSGPGNYSVIISGNNLPGSLLSSDGVSNIYVSSSTGAFLTLALAGTNSGSSSVQVQVIDKFTDAFTSGLANEEPMMYATISANGGASFQANKSVVTFTGATSSKTSNGTNSLIAPIDPDSPVNPPIFGFGSLNVGAVSSLGFGRYTGLAYYNGNFFAAWADNSDITVSNIDGPLKQFDISVSRLVVPSSDLSLFITNSPNPVLSDAVIELSIVASNNGPSASTAVVTDTLPANVVFESAVPSIGATYSVSGNQIIFTIPSLPARTAVTNLILVTASSSQYGTNTAHISGTLPDSVPSNNTNTLVILFEGEDLAVTMSASASNLFGGQFITNSITVSNLGPSANGDVMVSNAFSANWAQLGVASGGFTLASAATSPGLYSTNNNVLVLNLGVLSSNQSTNLMVTALALASAPSGIDTVSVSSLDFDTNESNNSTNSAVAMTAESLSAATSVGAAQVGVPLTFTITVTNLGPSPYGYIVATNILPLNVSSIQIVQSPNPATVTNNNTIIFPIGVLSNGATATLVFTAVPQSAVPVTNIFTVSSFDYAPAVTSKTVLAVSPPATPIENFHVVPASSGAFVVWDTPVAATAQVDYGTTVAYGKVTSLSAPSTHHIVLLTGLTRGVTYYFNALTSEAGSLYTTNGSFGTTNSLILNTQDANYSGLWIASSTGAGIYGTYYQSANTTVSSPTASATYAPVIPVSGNYDVSIWYPISSIFSTNTPIHIVGATNVLATNLNQAINGGSWLPLASNVYFAAGNSGSVVIYNNTGQTNTGVAANAMQWVYDVAQDSPTNGTVPAWWANFYFGTNNNASGSADPDGDGYSNFAEYVFGTDPTDPTSRLNFNVTPLAGNRVSVSFSPYQGGRTYQLLTATDLSNPQWMALTNTPTVDANGNGVFTVTQPGAANAYYRLSATLAP
jgi:uncharacterized repeat protein (TIGR01451 family)